jgi:hypothetical protein
MKTEGHVDILYANGVGIGYGYARDMRGQGVMGIRGY